VQELAGELIALYARRQTAPGIAYDLSSDWLEKLETEFPYRETEDQQRRSHLLGDLREQAGKGRGLKSLLLCQLS
jgi:transcription-repair coupling factor (superfamily II helicase)